MTFCSYILQNTCCFIFIIPEITSEELEVSYELQIPMNLAGTLQIAQPCSVTLCYHWQNKLVIHETSSQSGCNLKFLMLIGLLWISACFFQVKKNPSILIWSVQATSSIPRKDELQLTSWIPLKSPRYQVSQECQRKGTQTLENQNYK